MKRLFMAALAISLVGCSGLKSTPVQGPNGQAYAIQCNANRAESCYQRAAELCPNGYELTSQSGSVVGNATVTVSKTNMLVSCR